MKALSGAVFYKESIEISTLNIKHRLYVWFWSAKKIVKRRNFVLDQPGAARQINYDSKMLSRYTVHTADTAQHCGLWWYSGKLKSLFLTTNTFISKGNQMQFCHYSTRVICRCCFACAVWQMIFYQHTQYVLYFFQFFKISVCTE